MQNRSNSPSGHNFFRSLALVLRPPHQISWELFRPPCERFVSGLSCLNPRMDQGPGWSDCPTFFKVRSPRMDIGDFNQGSGNRKTPKTITSSPSDTIDKHSAPAENISHHDFLRFYTMLGSLYSAGCRCEF